MLRPPQRLVVAGSEHSPTGSPIKGKPQGADEHDEVLGMIRCHGCGRRLADSDPRCPTHGSALARPPSDEPPPTPMAAPEIPGYALGRLLGQGGFGAVFKAERLSDHQVVALKIARSDNSSAGESLLREVAALSALGPPAVPEVYEQSALTDEMRWVAMELVD